MTMFDVPDQPGIAAAIFEAVAAENILVDMIVQRHRPRRPGQPQLHRAAKQSVDARRRVVGKARRASSVRRQ